MMKRESWRTSAGSLAGKEARRNRKNSLDPDDFRDVFGGPPKSVLLRRFAGDLSAYRRTRPSPLSDEVLQPSAGTRRAWVRTETGFYDDIFGSHGDLRSARGSRSKSSESPSILSSEHVSPSIRGDSTPADVVLSSSLAYKLRPIAAPRCHKSSSPLSANSREDHSNRSSITMQRPSRSFCNLFAQQSCFSYRETSNLEASFRGRHEKPLRCDSSATESPASGMSSVIFDHPLLAEAEAEAEAEDVMMEEEAAECSFSIEVGGHDMQESIDEAIAWAKEKFWN